MQSKAATVEQNLAELPADRRIAIEAVRNVILQNLDKDFEEGMQYGMIGYHVPHRIYPAGYHCDPRQPLPFAALASQKNYMSVYLGCVYSDADQARWFQQAWAKAGKKLDMGKSCIRFKRVEDLALDVIGETIRRTPARKFIAYYESVIKTDGIRAAMSKVKPVKRDSVKTKETKSGTKTKATKAPAKKPARKPARRGA